jgi:hypothetical protein
VAVLDVDRDGWEDLLLATGNKHDVQDADALAALGSSAGRTTPAMRLQERSRLPPRQAPSLALRNRRDLTFEDASARWGFGAVGVAHGIALGDLDNDGPRRVNLHERTCPLYRSKPAPNPRALARPGRRLLVASARASRSAAAR